MLVRGDVQGVGFRYFTQRQAARMNLVGWVRNLPDGDVEVYLEGEEDDIRRMIQILSRGPDYARVDEVKETWRTPSGSFSDFRITY
ncbi:acylphosphatase [bacterium]|nr:acylphosphatase [bacterium]